MRIGAVAVLFALAACTAAAGPTAARSSTAPTPSATSPSPLALASPTPAASAGASPTPEPPIATLNCPVPPPSGHSLALVHDSSQDAPLEVVDVADPVRPVLDCTLVPAAGGRFIGSNQVAFWAGHRLERADLSTGRVVQTAILDFSVTQGAFSADGLEFAYRSYRFDSSLGTHVVVNGVDRILYFQDPMGGFGPPPVSNGPFSRLEFSPDGTELLDFLSFRPESPYLKLFKMDGTQILPHERGNSGVWASGGSLLYYSADADLASEKVFSLDAAGQERLIATIDGGGYWWPAISPDGKTIVFNSASTPVPACGGLPNLWRLDLASGTATQVSRSLAYEPVFVGRDVVWSNEERQVPCGIGGPGAPDGVVRAFDFRTGTDGPVDTSLFAPGTFDADLVLDVQF